MTVHTKPRGLMAVRANANPGNLIAELDSAFSEFKSKYSGRADELDARIDEIESMINRPHFGGGARGSNSDARELANFFSAVKRRDISPSEASGEDLGEYERAFASYLRLGDSAPSAIKAEMQVGNDPDGGYWVAPQLIRDIKRRLFDTSPMRSISSVMTVAGADSIQMPLDTNDATSGGWVAETGTRSETDIGDLGMQTIYVREQYAMPKVTQKLLDMSSFPVEGWLTQKISDKLGRTENTGFVSGTGVNQPRGFLDYKSDAVTTDDASRDWGVLQYVPSGAAGGFPQLSGTPGADDANALITLQHKLKMAYRANATWLMNRSTAATVRKLRDADGRHIWQDSLVQGQPPMLLGSPVVFAEDMPDISSDSFSIAYGDFMQGYQIIDGPGVRVLRDPFTTKGKVKFYTTAWTGGDVVDFDALKLLKFSVS